jgi:hypothetical protein
LESTRLTLPAEVAEAIVDEVEGYRIRKGEYEYTAPKFRDYLGRGRT